MNSRRLVTIAIPAYKPDFFETALRSAFRQTHDDIEIVICDDCKDDAMHRIVERLRPDSPWPIRYFRNETSLGETKNLARCIREAHGEYIKFLYDDDLLHPECVSSLFELLDGHPDITLASSRRQWVNEEGEAQPDNWATTFPFAHDVIFSGVELASFLGQFRINFVGEPSCVMVRRADVAAFGDDLMALNGTSITWVGDLAIYVKLLRKGNLAMRAERLSYFRVSRAQYSAKGRHFPSLGDQGQLVFCQRMSELGWTRSLDQYRMQKLATLEKRDNFTEVDLLPYFGGNLPPERFGLGVSHWLGRRKLNLHQRKLINDRIEHTRAGSALLLVVLDDGRLPQKVDVTLHSIMAHQTLSTGLNVVVLSSRDRPATFANSAHLQWHRHARGTEVGALNELLEQHGCDWFMVAEAGVSFIEHGISRVRLKLPELPRSPALFADELYRMAEGGYATALRPDFNLDYLLSYPAAMSQHWIFHRRTIVGMGGFNPEFAQAMELDLILRLVESEGVAELYHLAEPLLVCDAVEGLQREGQDRALARHLNARGYVNSQIYETGAGQYQIRYNHAEKPLVSILIPTKDQLGILSRCVESVLEKTAYSDYEIIIIDNNSEEPDALEWLAGVESMQSDKVRVLRHPFPFNYSEINNTAARHARGEYLVLLNNDTAVLHPEWLDNLLNHALRPEVGIVGAKLYYPDGAIQHAGVVMGIDSPAQHVFLGAPQNSPGYMQRLLVDQDYSVVTAACLMIRKSLYEEVGGLDEVNFKVSYNDVDLCLKVRQSGYLVVWTPHVQLLHESSVSQVQTDKTAHERKVARFRGEQLAMYRKWLPMMANDPAYNPNLALTGTGFEFEPNVDLTWRALPWRPQPLVLAHRTLRWNDGDQRITTPLETMRELNLLDGATSARWLHIAEIERLQPAAIVFQRAFTHTEVNGIELIQQCSPAKRILDIDRLPAGYRKDPLFLRSLELVDRVVVSSSRLALALEGLHQDIHVVPDHLPPLWRHAQRERNRGERLRVGWCGDHDALDLELLAQIMPALANEVDFVVMGWCPIPLRPYVRDQRYQVEAAYRKEALASLDLDLALLPLRHNGLEDCQSVTRLLEYGACGFPVICSIHACDDATLPVTRVERDAQSWIDTIRGQITNIEALARQGDALQREIRAHWMLDEGNLQIRRDAWLT
ncbi:Glycosyltransferase, GT2 family [Pseudomonas sp. NFACC02]|uniref:glycosyltransferase family 2 protein n=1 Tax=Pseudomonas sp. NFACC02 TaxID=1566250 RepID=UPI0008BC8DD2|nr:glycosyltransferase [Pseudomonas sp. NFACC02]SEQ35764.1 Glycosyltransferase, GT2 family [Pseudomonas sp. NFACC02]